MCDLDADTFMGILMALFAVDVEAARVLVETMSTNITLRKYIVACVDKAVSEGQAELVRFLLDNPKIAKGVTRESLAVYLQIAARRGHAATATTLLQFAQTAQLLASLPIAGVVASIRKNPAMTHAGVLWPIDLASEDMVVRDACRAQVLQSIRTLNPECKQLSMQSNWHGEDLKLSAMGIRQLPASFGNVTVGRDLSLNNNQLASLPASFGGVTVGGSLWLSHNHLESLPESFGGVAVGGYLGLSFNKLASLPESFADVTVKGDLWLNHNQLQSLPESFGNVTVGENLKLDNNKLQSLPESFGNVTVGGDLWLNNNQLETLSVIFGNVKGSVFK